MVEYRPSESCCGAAPLFLLPSEDMRAVFAGSPGGLPEAPLIDWAWREFGGEGLFVDVGAHVGQWTLPFAAAGVPVVAFEPNPPIRALLSAAIRQNGLAVSLWPFALGAAAGSGHLTAPEIGGGMASIVCEFPGGPVSETVEVRSLDHFSLAPRLLKLDVEGAEVDVLRGAHETIRQHRPVVIFECWEDERGQRTSELFATLAEYGYRTERNSWPETWVAYP